jgi:hypothetical protein
MSFPVPVDLLRLAGMAGARCAGISLPDIEEEAAVNTRTAQRMTEALEAAFPQAETHTEARRRKYWRLGAGDARSAERRALPGWPGCRRARPSNTRIEAEAVRAAPRGLQARVREGASAVSAPSTTRPSWRSSLGRRALRA